MDEIMEEQEFEEDFDLRQPEGIQEDNPLFVAVIKNDLNTLKSLIKSGESANSKNREGDTLLIHIIKHGRAEMFHYILSLEELQIDQIDSKGRSALLYTVMPQMFDSYFKLELINKGANIHLTCDGGTTILHMAARNRSNNLNLSKLVIEKGIDVNAQDSFGRTPLYMACKQGNFDYVHMLLYYGALASIPSNDGTLPLSVLSRPGMHMIIREEDHAHLVETLYSLSIAGLDFESNKIIVQLPTLVVAMTQESLLFPKLVEIVSDVDYELSDLTYLYQSLIQCRLKIEHFKLFVDKFGNILQEMIQNNYSPLKKLIDFIHPGLEALKVNVGLILTILESNCAAEFVQNAEDIYPKTGALIMKLNRIPHMRVEEVTKIVCLMLSHGLSLNSRDLNMVYDLYGYCELFKILLHMEFRKVVEWSHVHSIAEFFYDPSMDIEIFFDGQESLHSRQYLEILSYYNHPKLKELFLSGTDVDEKIAAKAQSLPPVPSLLELSRNMTRKFIVNRYKIKNSMGFYTILRWLPINETFKEIIALEMKLY